MKRTIFFGLSGGLGPVLRCLPIAEEFRKAGDKVYFSVYGSSSAAFIEKQGYTHLPDDDPVMPTKEKTVTASSAFYDMDHYYAQAGLLDEVFAEAWIRHRIYMIEQIQADLVFADMSPHTIIAARYLGIPAVSITQSCFHPRGERVFSWGEAPRNLAKVTPIINKIMQKLKLPEIHRMENLNSGDLDIIPGIPEMDPIDDSFVRYVGPINYEMKAEKLDDVTFNKHIDGEPYILVYPGRLQDSSGSSGLKLVELIYQAFGGHFLRVVIATNEQLPRELRKKRFRNIQVVSYFTEKMLNQSSLFIHHGGHGSCLSAIIAGVPSLIIPTQTEREFNARKLWRLGVCEYMLPDTFTAEHLYRMSIFIMEDEYRKRTNQLRVEIINRRYRGAYEVFQQSKSLFTGQTAR